MNNWKLLRGPVNQFTLARAYLQGDVDLEVEGDLTGVFVVRDRMGGGTSVTQAARLLGELALVAPRASTPASSAATTTSATTST